MIKRSAEHRDNRRRTTATRGQIMIMFAAGLVLLIGIVAMAIDVGFLMAERRQVQNAADAGALAAAKAKLDYLTDANRQTIEISTGKQYGASNAGTVEDNVDVDPDPDGYSDEYVEVAVTKDVQSFFIQALYSGDWRVAASAVAGIEPVKRPYALLALDCGPSGSPGIYINGSGNIDVNEGSIMSNCGIDRSGDSNIVVADGAIDAHGSINAGPQWSADDGINENRPPVNDPIVELGIDPPSESDARTVRTVTTSSELQAAVSNLNNVTPTGARCPNGATCVMQPGYYGGNLTLDIRGTVEMQPGIYYFGDDFRLEGNNTNAIVNGDDVLLYFTDNARLNPGNAHINLAAPENSPYQDGLDGMLLWIANCTPFLMQSNGSFELDGVIYAPCSRVRLYGSPGASGMQVVVGNLELAGGNTFNILYEEYIEADTPHVFLVQ